MNKPSRLACMLAVSFSFTGFCLPAIAGSFALREQSARGLGLSFAGVGAGSGGLSSAFWNPATITMNPGLTFESSVTLVAPQSTIKPDLYTLGTVRAAGGVPRDSGNISQAGVLPASTAAIQLNDRFWLGLTTNTPFGFVTKPNQDWAGQVYGRTSKVFSLNATPIIAYKVNDWLSLGAGIQVQYLDVTLRQASGIGFGAPNVSLEGDHTGVGYVLGATLTPAEGTVIGLGFRSSIHHELDGSLLPRPGVSVPVRAKVNLPEVLTLGLSQRIDERWTLLAGVEWTNWSRLNRVAVVNKVTGTPATALKFQYDDGWFFSLGAEYKVDDRLTLRGGLGYELSPISDAVRNVRIPDADRLWTSLGASYRWNDKLSFDVSYAHLFVKPAPVRIVPGHPDYVGLPFVADLKPSADIVSVGMRYRWDDPEQPLAVFR
ncbi:OmpP1/FadL family transporter [Pseudochelatococcus lubricantis]|uniref:OmpP1/FadL family transporter n=1 Tax=Pseudochelatococcus lubricantis TaxID=1538102 RepID=UPI0035E58F82